MPFQHQDNNWMSRAIRLAERGRYSTQPNPRVGCVIVKENQLISEGWHIKAGEAHAEVNAITATSIPPDCTVYVTLEPCSHTGRTPPCVEKLIQIKPRRVVIAMVDPNPLVSGKGIEMLRAVGIKVECGLMGASAHQLNAGFIKRMETGRPFVRLKMAMSTDGKTALNNGQSQWITAEPARRDVQFLRAESAAVLSTAESVISDNARLNVRLSPAALGQNTEIRQPVRVVIDANNRLDGTESLFDLPGNILIYSNKSDKSSSRLHDDSKVETVQLESERDKRIDLTALLEDLGTRGINELFCEVGAKLAGSLIELKLVDELIVYMAPKILGNKARGLVELEEFESLEQCIDISLKEVRQIGSDLRLTYDLGNH